ncbi:hypothetical protein GLOIN_2v1777821 [Rhizophagus clarus]|uniref:Uncharacterized protein n=1 Tax=Rhizophagus clarus TaxID=94130 RepID=A0A8H3LLI2_9GLOM|nr:hypothetical protein GLOIN_2v1777821 [Rhizophagus clarus]
MLNQVVEKYIKKKEHQRMKPITSDCENLLRKENEELYILKQILEKKIEELLDLQEQYKSHEVAIIRFLEKTIALAEKSIDMLENKCQYLEDIISAKNRKIITLTDKISLYISYNDINIELEVYFSIDGRKL